MPHLMRILVVFLIALLALPALAQDEELPVQRPAHIIETAEIEMTDDGAMLNLTGTLPDGCDVDAIMHTERQGEVVYVELYRELPGDVMCPAMLVMFEEQINVQDELFELDENETLPGYLVINHENAFRLNYAQIEPVEGATTPPPLLTRLLRVSDIIHDIAVDTDGETITLNITGMRGGCEATQHVRLQPNLDNESIIEVAAFRLIEEDQICTRELRLLEITLETDIPSDADVTFEIAPRSQETIMDEDTGEAVVRAPFVIDDVQVLIMESDPPQIRLDIDAHQTDMCEFPAEVSESREGDTITVEIYREIPITVTCMVGDVAYSDTITLNSDVAVGESLTIDVNGTIIEVDL